MQWSTFEDDYVVHIATRSVDISDTNTRYNSIGFQDFVDTENKATRQDEDKDLHEILGYIKLTLLETVHFRILATTLFYVGLCLEQVFLFM